MSVAMFHCLFCGLSANVYDFFPRLFPFRFDYNIINIHNLLRSVDKILHISFYTLYIQPPEELHRLLYIKYLRLIAIVVGFW